MEKLKKELEEAKRMAYVEKIRHKEEEKNDPEFAKKLASLGEVYVNDAFGSAHRAHASTEGVARYLPAVSGFLMEKEIEYLSRATQNPQRPYVAIMGGAKISDKITIIGIAKKLEEIYFPGDSVPIYLDKNSISLKIIQQIRNEAHRFGINFHRDKRSSDMIKSDLDMIKGIGPRTKDLLLKKIGSIEKIRTTSPERLEDFVGKHKASILIRYFRT